MIRTHPSSRQPTTYLFHCPFHDVAYNLHGLLLTHPENASNRLAFDRGIPLRFEYMYLIGNFQPVETEALSVWLLLSRDTVAYPTAPVPKVINSMRTVLDVSKSLRILLLLLAVICP